MNQGNARIQDPGAQGPDGLEADAEAIASPVEASLAEGGDIGGDDARMELDEPGDEYDPLGGADEDGDDFDEFGRYGQMAMGAMLKGGRSMSEPPKMRGNRDASAGKKLNKPAHKDKRDF